MYEGKRIFARYDVFGDNIDLQIRSRDDQGILKISPVMKDEDFTIPRPGAIIPPTLSISLDAGQELMDQLWQCGLRPTEGKGSAGALAATERHLHDMQKIAFNLLDKQ